MQVQIARRNDSINRRPSIIDAVVVNSESLVDSVRVILAREVHGCQIPRHKLLHRGRMESLELHYRILGHVSSVFCVTFDRMGLYAITGADDRLVKVWSIRTGLLRFTLRGHSAEISDMFVSHDNRLLATGSVDKTVRVWNLQTAATVTVFRAHTAAIATVFFSPFAYGTRRYLVSAGYDCTVNFYGYDEQSHLFE